MKTYKEYVQEKEQGQIAESFMMLYYVSQIEHSQINEASVLQDMAAKLNSVLPKVGLKLHKGDGLISYLSKFATIGGKMLVAAVKRDKAAIKMLATQVSRAEFIDFLFKLDMVSLHLVTNPIHMIDAITGWDLMSNLQAHAKKAGAVVDDIVAGIHALKTKITQVLDDNVAKPFLSFFGDLEATIQGA